LLSLLQRTSDPRERARLRARLARL